MKKGDKQIKVIGDRVLIVPDLGEDRSEVGLYLPKWAVEKESVQGGRIVATGPGLPLPTPNEIDDEPWKSTPRETHYVPMQADVGDYAIFLRKAAVEIKLDGEAYLVVPHAAILLLIRESE